MAAGQPVYGLVRTFPWFDLGTWSAYGEACRAVLRREGDDGAFEQVHRLSPGRFLAAGEGDGGLVGPAYVGPGATVEAGGSGGPDLVLQAGSRLRPGADVREGFLLPGATAEGVVRRLVLGRDFTLFLE
jgi:NDP-sugar pyrophosphorylase family protein